MNHKLLNLLFVVLLSFISCRSDDSLITEKLNPASVDVYVAGMENNKACYWKNGVINYLQNSDGITPQKIIVENNNVYVFGQKYISYFMSEYYYWKNNVRYELKNYLGVPSTSLLYISDFTIKNNVELFTGYLNDTGVNQNLMDLCYWKNGVKTVLQINTNFIYNLAIDYYNNNVFVSSNLGYYKNDVLQTVGGTNQNFAKTNNDVYFLTISNNQNLNYIKTSTNQISYINLNDNTVYPNFGRAKIISDVINNDLYTFSYDISNLYYKNNTIVNFIDPNYSQINDMKALNNNLYMIRSFAIISGPPTQISLQYKVFINNVETQYINGTNGSFNSIFVVQN